MLVATLWMVQYKVMSSSAQSIESTGYRIVTSTLFFNLLQPILLTGINFNNTGLWLIWATKSLRCRYSHMPQLIMTSSNGNIFRVTGHLCGNSPVPGEFPAQRPVTRSFDVFFDLCLNKWLSKQSQDWWFEMPSRSLWRQRNVQRRFY